MFWEDLILPGIFGAFAAGLMWFEYIILTTLFAATGLGAVIGLALLFIILLGPIMFLLVLLFASIVAML